MQGTSIHFTGLDYILLPYLPLVEQGGGEMSISHKLYPNTCAKMGGGNRNRCFTIANAQKSGYVTNQPAKTWLVRVSSVSKILIFSVLLQAFKPSKAIKANIG